MLLKVLDIHNTAHMLCIVHKSQLNKKNPTTQYKGEINNNGMQNKQNENMKKYIPNRFWKEQENGNNGSMCLILTH